MLVAPQSGEPTKKTVEGKEYWFCTNHKSWCHHPTDKCKGRNVATQQISAPNEGAHEENSKRTLQLTQALAHLAEAESDDE
jgi:hypothetical protein